MISVYLKQTITWHRHISFDSRNEPTYAAGAEIKARVNWKNGVLRVLKGEEVVFNGTVLVRPDQEMGYNDLLTIDSADHIILMIGKETDFSDRFKKLWIA
jgi:hypothetical protein